MRGNFKEFKKICQGKKLEKQKQKRDWWHALPRLISIYITWIIVKTPITANMVTLFGIAIAFLGLIFIFLNFKLTIIIGFILLYIYYVSDEVDGEVARYKKQTSIKGIYYDELGHLIIYGILFFVFGYNLYNITSEILYIILGFVGSFFLLGMRAVRKISIIAYSKTAANKIIYKEQLNEQISKSKKKRKKLILAIIINLINAFSHSMLITTLFFIGYLLYIYFALLWILKLLLISYVIFMGIVFIVFTFTKFKSLEKDIIKVYNSINQ